jgi:hypothetical protein
MQTHDLPILMQSQRPSPARNHQAALTRTERALLVALGLAILAAVFVPDVAQPAHYHAFADQRTWLGVPFAMDVLSNLPFAVAGIWGLVISRRLPQNQEPGTTWLDGQLGLAKLFFCGLIVTAICSSIYHLQPHNQTLTLDRLGMVVAFAGLLGLALADRVSTRSGRMAAALMLALGPVSIGTWTMTSNLLPWVILQGGAMLLVILLSLHKPLPGKWSVKLGWVITAYAVAKLFELGDAAVFEATQGLIAGHSLKHVVAALAAWPVIYVMHNHRQNSNPDASARNIE